MPDKNHLMFTDDAGDDWVRAKEYDRLRAEVQRRSIRRTFCFHAWEMWSEPFTGTWVLGGDQLHETEGYMTQKRKCTKCGRVSYRRCQ